MSDKAVCVLAFTDNQDLEKVVNIISKSDDMIAPDASLWLWTRGKYENGALSGVNWKIAFNLEQHDGWLVRNEIVFPCKVADPAPENRLKRGYEKLLHLVRSPNYYYDRTMGKAQQNNLSRNKGGTIVTRSGVVGTKYLRQINGSPFLSEEEKSSALIALRNVGTQLDRGEISDFRLILRGVHKTTKNISEKVDQHGFYIRITKYHSLPMDDLWTSFSFETNARVPSGALLSILRLSCPVNGLVLDLFPSTDTEKTVVESGRVYVTRVIGEGYVVSHQEVSIFENEEVSNGENIIELSNQEC
jgi:hypothetical protein